MRIAAQVVQHRRRSGQRQGAGAIAVGERIVFVHTGGIFGLFGNATAELAPLL